MDEHLIAVARAMPAYVADIDERTIENTLRLDELSTEVAKISVAFESVPMIDMDSIIDFVNQRIKEEIARTKSEAYHSTEQSRVANSADFTYVARSITAKSVTYSPSQTRKLKSLSGDTTDVFTAALLETSFVQELESWFYHIANEDKIIIKDSNVTRVRAPDTDINLGANVYLTLEEVALSLDMDVPASGVNSIAFKSSPIIGSLGKLGYFDVEPSGPYNALGLKVRNISYASELLGDRKLSIRIPTGQNDLLAANFSTPTVTVTFGAKTAIVGEFETAASGTHACTVDDVRYGKTEYDGGQTKEIVLDVTLPIIAELYVPVLRVGTGITVPVPMHTIAQPMTFDIGGITYSGITPPAGYYEPSDNSDLRVKGLTYAVSNLANHIAAVEARLAVTQGHQDNALGVVATLGGFALTLAGFLSGPGALVLAVVGAVASEAATIAGVAEGQMSWSDLVTTTLYAGTALRHGIASRHSTTLGRLDAELTNEQTRRVKDIATFGADVAQAARDVAYVGKVGNINFMRTETHDVRGGTLYKEVHVIGATADGLKRGVAVAVYDALSSSWVFPENTRSIYTEVTANMTEHRIAMPVESVRSFMNGEYISPTNDISDHLNYVSKNVRPPGMSVAEHAAYVAEQVNILPRSPSEVADIKNQIITEVVDSLNVAPKTKTEDLAPGGTRLSTMSKVLNTLATVGLDPRDRYSIISYAYPKTIEGQKMQDAVIKVCTDRSAASAFAALKLGYAQHKNNFRAWATSNYSGSVPWMLLSSLILLITTVF